MLEPSLLSQLIVLGVVIDYFILRQKLFLPVYAVALLVSYSGTGILALAITLMVSGLLSPKQLPQTAMLVVVGAIAVAAFAVAFPAEFATLAARAGGGDASSQQRYASQLDVINMVVNNPRIVIGFGPGAAEGYVNAVAAGAMSPLLKLLFDYGLIGVIAFSGFIFKALWRPDQKMLSIICLVIFQVGGGYLVFSPWVFLFALVCIWSKPVSPLAFTMPNGAAPSGFGPRAFST
ncbi:MAG: O-antigen ligase family protein [Caulobacteraceae bacterium]